MLFIIQVVRGW